MSLLPGTKAMRIGFLSPPASLVWLKPAGRLGTIVVLVVPDPVNASPDSVPVTVAVSATVVPAAADWPPMMETDQTPPAAMVPVVQVTTVVLLSKAQLPVLTLKNGEVCGATATRVPI